MKCFGFDINKFFNNLFKKNYDDYDDNINLCSPNVKKYITPLAESFSCLDEIEIQRSPELIFYNKPNDIILINNLK